MFINKKIKWVFLIFLCIFFGFFIIFVINYENSDFAKEVFEKEINIKEIENTLANSEINNLKINLGDSEGFYNAKENTYFILIDEKYVDTFSNSKLKITAKDFKYAILNEKYSEKEKFYIDFENDYELLVYNDKEYYKTKIKFTSVPIINITVDDEGFIIERPSTIEVYSKDYKKGKGTIKEETEALLSFRGGSTIMYPKKQYRLNLTKDKEKNKISLLGMDADEDWILDAMYSDYSKIRNKLSNDIWNEMNSFTKNNFDNDIEMEYVDVFINEEYHGLYMLKEFLDWKKVGIDKYTEANSGVLLKGVQYGGFDYEHYDEIKVSEKVLPFVMKYPKNQENYSKFWDAILPRIYTNFFEPGKITEEYLLDNFYIHNYNDYKIFVNFIYAADNFKEQNAYLSIKNLNKDTKVLLTPWDLDTTYGYVWSGEEPTYLEEASNVVNEINNLWIGSEYIDGLLENRYWELRKNILNMENINEKIDSYYNKIKYTAKRDSEKWLETNLEEEMNKIRKWLEKRIEVLDKEFENNKKEN